MAAELQKLEGVVESVIFHNDENGYAVFSLDAGGTDVVVAGQVGEVHNGMSVVVYGHMGVHQNYGEQFYADGMEASMPQTEGAIRSYLASGALPYIGPATARKLVKKFGAEVLNIIAEDPERLCEVKGITPEKAHAISKEYHRMYGARELIAWMARYGIPAQSAISFYTDYGPHSLEALQQNPYLLCSEPLNLPFSRVDPIAISLDMDRVGALRLSAGLLYTLRRNTGNGHTCLPRDKLVAATAAFLQVDPEETARALESMLAEEEVRARTFAGREYIYLPDLLAAEEEIAARLGELSTYPTEPPATLDSDIRVLEMAQGFAYAPLQREAVRLALSSRVMVLTGGPGTGKTTTVNAILALYEDAFDKVALCAPTGRAAKRLSELTHHNAATIHRLLEVRHTAKQVQFVHNERNLLPFDVVILDEMSMVDVKLFQALLAACRPHCRFVLVGDADQLPSVGPGNILSEILQANVLPTVRLTEIFRQAGQSLIVRNAHRIVRGEMPEQGGKDDDFFMMESQGEACRKLVCDLVTERLPRAYHLDPMRDIQVLCPGKRGLTGSEELNARLQQLLNPPAPDKPEIVRGGRVLRLGDKVMQVKNDYDITYEAIHGESGTGAYNGDMGVIIEVDPGDRTLKARIDDRVYTYTADQLEELEPAYAVTIHKSQGSEFPVVVIPLADVYEKLQTRNLLYTGVTRARQLCVLPGRRQTVRNMVRRAGANKRYSCLRYLLAQAAGQA